MRDEGFQETERFGPGPVSAARAYDAGGSVDNLDDIRPQIYLQPIASPSVLGLYALGASAFIFGAYMAEWYGSESTAVFLFPFLAVFGGLAQFLAGMWAFRARDVLAVAMFTVIGSFWLAYGLLQWAVMTDDIAVTAGGSTEFGYWLLVLAAIVWVGTIAASQRSVVLAVSFGAFALSATLLAIGQLGDSDALVNAGGWVMVAAGILAWYTASALLLDEAMDREVLPLMRTHDVAPLDRGLGEAGVMQGNWMADDITKRRRAVTRSEPQWEFQWPFRRKED